MSQESIDLRIPLPNGHALFARENVRQSVSCSSSALAPIMIVVHGGPGLADHTESYAGLRRLLDVCDCHAMFFYDQLGCGSSDKPVEFDYTMSYYVNELSQVVDFVKDRHSNRKICLLGHSWGGQLVLEYICRDKPSVSGAIVSNSPLDEAAYENKQRELRALLDEDVRRFLKEDEVAHAADGSVGSAIYSKLIGISEATITGEMRGWSILQRLGDLKVPCLFVSGTEDNIPFDRYEMATKHGHVVEIIHGAGHGPFFGQTADEYFRVIHNFLQTI